MSEELIKRAEDLRERCERTCSVTATTFLTPAEQYVLAAWAKRAADCRMILRGGVEGTERCAAFFLPSGVSVCGEFPCFSSCVII